MQPYKKCIALICESVNQNGITLSQPENPEILEISKIGVRGRLEPQKWLKITILTSQMFCVQFRQNGHANVLGSLNTT